MAVQKNKISLFCYTSIRYEYYKIKKLVPDQKTGPCSVV